MYRYLAREKIRGKALDAVANFHLQNGAVSKPASQIQFLILNPEEHVWFC